MKTSFIRLYHPYEFYVSDTIALRRITPHFRHVKLDRARGLADFLAERDEFLATNPPEVFRDSYNPDKCRRVWVELADDDLEPLVRFILKPGCEICIEFPKYTASADLLRLRKVVGKLAKLLGYDVYDLAMEDELERKRERCYWRDDDVDEELAAELALNAPRIGGDAAFRYSFWFRPHENPPGLHESFTIQLHDYLARAGFEFTIVEGRRSNLQGYVRGLSRPVTDQDCEAFFAWAQTQHIKCRLELTDLAEEIDPLELFENFIGRGREIDNLTPAEKAEAAGCRAAAEKYERGSSE